MGASTEVNNASLVMSSNSDANANRADRYDRDKFEDLAEANEPTMEELTIDELLVSFGPLEAEDDDQEPNQDLEDTGTFPAAEFLLAPDEIFPNDDD